MSANVVRREKASEAPMRNMNTGAPVGPPKKRTTWPIGDAHAASVPYCASTWTKIMNRTARPLARSNARIRGWTGAAAGAASNRAGAASAADICSGASRHADEPKAQLGVLLRLRRRGRLEHEVRA